MSFIDKISVNAHSSILIKDKYNFRFDPYMIGQNLHDSDIIFITHPHYDHYSPNDIKKVSKDGTLMVAPENMRSEMYRVSSNVKFMNVNDNFDYLNVHIRAVSSYNSKKEYHIKDAGWLGYVLTFARTKVYVAGDLDKCDEAVEGFCDIAIVPIGGTYTFDYKSAAKFVNRIKPKYVIPTHYASVVGDSQDADKFASLVDNNIKVVCKIPKNT